MNREVSTRRTLILSIRDSKPRLGNPSRHSCSTLREAQTYQRIHEKIQERVMNNLDTWIDR